MSMGRCFCQVPALRTYVSIRVARAYSHVRHASGRRLLLAVQHLRVGRGGSERVRFCRQVSIAAGRLEAGGGKDGSEWPNEQGGAFRGDDRLYGAGNGLQRVRRAPFYAGGDGEYGLGSGEGCGAFLAQHTGFFSRQCNVSPLPCGWRLCAASQVGEQGRCGFQPDSENLGNQIRVFCIVFR